MQATLHITNADNHLIKALKSVISLYPQAKLKIEKKQAVQDEVLELDNAPIIKTIKASMSAKERQKLKQDLQKELGLK